MKHTTTVTGADGVRAFIVLEFVSSVVMVEDCVVYTRANSGPNAINFGSDAEAVKFYDELCADVATYRARNDPASPLPLRSNGPGPEDYEYEVTADEFWLKHTRGAVVKYNPSIGDEAWQLYIDQGMIKRL